LLSSLPRPQDLALSARPVAISLGVTLVLTLGALAVMPFVGIPLVGIPLPTFPSELFDSTLDETYDEIKRRFRFLQGPVRLVKRIVEVVSERGLVASTLVALVAAGLYALLDDRFRVNLPPLGVYGAALLGIVAMTFGFRLPSALYVRRRYRVKVRARALPGTLGIAAACVAISHLAHFEPGYLYGIVAGFTWSRLEGKDAGHAVTRSAVGIFLATFLLSWAAWGARGFITNPEAGWALFADQLLAMIYLGGFEAMIITMLPLRFLDGRHLVAWNWKVWALLLGLGILGFVHVLIMDPRSEYLHRSEAMATLVIPLVGFGLLSLGFWMYCRSRGEFAKVMGEAGSPSRRPAGGEQTDGQEQQMR
jgi:hypothetical protein